MTAADRSLLVATARRFDVELHREALDRLARFVTVLSVWNQRVRLTAERDPREVIEKHVADSLAPARFLPGEGPLFDIGSGAGFPGIVLSCLRPDLEVVLIDSRRRRTSFLREAIRSIPLPRADAVEMRAERAAADPRLAGRARLVTGRAVRLDTFLALAAPLVAPEGEVLAMQTPRAVVPTETAAACGLRLCRRHDYVLPRGARRTLLLFAREPVS